MIVDPHGVSQGLDRGLERLEGPGFGGFDDADGLLRVCSWTEVAHDAKVFVEREGEIMDDEWEETVHEYGNRVDVKKYHRRRRMHACMHACMRDETPRRKIIMMMKQNIKPTRGGHDIPESLSMTHRLSPPVSPLPRPPPPPPPPPVAPPAPPPPPMAEESDDDDDESSDELAAELESSEPAAAQNFDMVSID